MQEKKMRNSYNLISRPERKRIFGRHKCRWKKIPK
jgi:hypothetical protein